MKNIFKNWLAAGLLLTLILNACDLFNVSLVEYLRREAEDGKQDPGAAGGPGTGQVPGPGGEPYVYVAVNSGNNSNSGWSAGEAVKTLGRAVDIWVAKGSTKANIMLTEDVIQGVYNENGVTFSNKVIDFSSLTKDTRSGITAITLAGADGGKIIGGGTALSGRWIVHINNSGKTITFKDLTISRGRGAYGGGVYIQAGELVILDGVSIQNNEAPAGTGGGVYVQYGNLAIKGGEIHTNQAGSDSGGGVYVQYGNVTMYSGAIRGNHVGGSNGKGGAVYVASSGTFTMYGGTISGNTADAAGGGVYAGPGGIFIMEGGVIRDNTAGNGGGGVYVSGSVLLPGKAIIKNGTIKENKARHGGGLYAGNFGRLELGSPPVSDPPPSGYPYDYPYIQNNQAGVGGSGTGGGIVINYDDLLGSWATVFFYHGTVSGNTGDTKGGGILVHLGILDMRGGKVFANSAAAGPGIMVECPAAGSAQLVMSGYASAMASENPIYLDKNGSGKQSIYVRDFHNSGGNIAFITTNGYSAGDPILKKAIDAGISMNVSSYVPYFNVDGKNFGTSLNSSGKLL
jgi:hypothetical protein